MAAASACRAEKSARERPRGRVGGQRRWRLGVEGKVVTWFWFWFGGGRFSLSESERRRFLDAGGGVFGCGAFVDVEGCGVCADLLRLSGASMIGLAREG